MKSVVRKYLPQVGLGAPAMGLPIAGLYLGVLLLHAFNCSAHDNCSYEKRNILGHIALGIYVIATILGGSVWFLMKIPVAARLAAVVIHGITFLGNTLVVITLACSFYGECL